MIWRARATSSPRRHKGGVGRLDLRRVDQGLAVEAEFASLTAGSGKALGIVEVEMHAVEDRPAMRPRAASSTRPSAVNKGRRSRVSFAWRSFVRSEVPRTSAPTRGLAPAISRSGENPERRLDHAPEGEPGRGAERVEPV